MLAMNKRKEPASEDDSDDAPSQESRSRNQLDWEQAVARPERCKSEGCYKHVTRQIATAGSIKFATKKTLQVITIVYSLLYGLAYCMNLCVSFGSNYLNTYF
jgi:hypothetical protein